MNIEYFECCSRKRVLMLKVLCLETTRGVNESLPLSSNTQKREGEGLKNNERGKRELTPPIQYTLLYSSQELYNVIVASCLS